PSPKHHVGTCKTPPSPQIDHRPSITATIHFHAVSQHGQRARQPRKNTANSFGAVAPYNPFPCLALPILHVLHHLCFNGVKFHCPSPKISSSFYLAVLSPFPSD